MRSPLVNKYADDPERYSDLQVLRSAAGYFIGTVYKSARYGMCPGSRDSEYFATKEAAEAALRDKTWTQRETP